MVTALNRQAQSSICKIPYDNMGMVMRFLPTRDLIQLQHSCVLLSDLERARLITEEEENAYYGCAEAAHCFNMRFPSTRLPGYSLPFSLPSLHITNPTRVSEDTQLALKSTISSLVELLRSTKLLSSELTTKQAVEGYYQAVLSPQFVEKLQIFLETGDPKGILDCIPDYVEIAPKVFKPSVNKQELSSQLISLIRIEKALKEHYADWIAGVLSTEGLIRSLKRDLTEEQKQSLIVPLRIFHRTYNPAELNMLNLLWRDLFECQDPSLFSTHLHEFGLPSDEREFLATQFFPFLHTLRVDVLRLYLLLSKGLFKEEAVCRKTVHRFLPPMLIQFVLEKSEKPIFRSNVMFLWDCLPLQITRIIRGYKVARIASYCLPTVFQKKFSKWCESRLPQHEVDLGAMFVRDFCRVLLYKNDSNHPSLKEGCLWSVVSGNYAIPWDYDEKKAAKLRVEYIKNLNEFFLSLLYVFPDSDSRKVIERVARRSLIDFTRDIRKNKSEVAGQAVQMRRLIRLSSPAISGVEFINAAFASQSYDLAIQMIADRIKERPLSGRDVSDIFFDDAIKLPIVEPTLDQKKQLFRLLLEKEPDLLLAHLYKYPMFRSTSPQICAIREIIDDLVKARGIESQFASMIRKRCTIM